MVKFVYFRGNIIEKNLSITNAQRFAMEAYGIMFLKMRTATLQLYLSHTRIIGKNVRSLQKSATARDKMNIPAASNRRFGLVLTTRTAEPLPSTTMTERSHPRITTNRCISFAVKYVLSLGRSVNKLVFLLIGRQFDRVVQETRCFRSSLTRIRRQHSTAYV